MGYKYGGKAFTSIKGFSKTSGDIIGGSQAERLKYCEKLKAGVIEDTAWSKLSKYADENDINLNSISWDEKMSMINKFKSETISDLNAMRYVENTKLIENWDETFYGNDSKVVISYMPKDAYDNFVLVYGMIGRAGEKGGQFVLPQKIGDSIESKLANIGSISDSTAEFKAQLAKELGLPEDVFANGVVRVEVPVDGDINLHIVTGVEDGCNYQWIPGGKTLGGTTEGIIRQITRDGDSELFEKIINNVQR